MKKAIVSLLLCAACRHSVDRTMVVYLVKESGDRLRMLSSGPVATRREALQVVAGSKKMLLLSKDVENSAQINRMINSWYFAMADSVQLDRQYLDSLRPLQDLLTTEIIIRSNELTLLNHLAQQRIGAFTPSAVR